MEFINKVIDIRAGRDRAHVHVDNEFSMSAGFGFAPSLFPLPT